MTGPPLPSSLSHDFTDHELYGHIADAFDNIVRISGHNKNINFGNIDASGGFSYLVDSPDVDVSGASYDLFQSEFSSKWSSPSDMDFALDTTMDSFAGMPKPRTAP